MSSPEEAGIPPLHKLGMMLGFRKDKRANLLGDASGDESYDQPEFV